LLPILQLLQALLMQVQLLLLLLQLLPCFVAPESCLDLSGGCCLFICSRWLRQAWEDP
jgi:hypothetical protein